MITKEMKERFSKLGFSELEIEVIEGDWKPPVVEAKPPSPSTRPTSSSEAELKIMFEVIKSKFPNSEVFSNKDLFPEVATLGYTNRQTPSRLKAIANLGLIEEVGAKSPKEYRVI